MMDNLLSSRGKRAVTSAALTPKSARKSQEATGFGQAFPTRVDIFNSTFDAMNKALQVDKLAPPQDFADSLARGLGESGGPLAETVALSALTAGVINPLTTGIAQKVPYLYSLLFPVARDAITFAAQNALEPGATPKSTAEGAEARAALGLLGPCGRIARALGGAGSPSLIRRAVDNLLAPYVQLVEDEGYRFSTAKFADFFGHSEEEARVIEEAVHPQPKASRLKMSPLPGDLRLAAIISSNSAAPVPIQPNQSNS
jgi:hypothetical protein